MKSSSVVLLMLLGRALARCVVKQGGDPNFASICEAMSPWGEDDCVLFEGTLFGCRWVSEKVTGPSMEPTDAPSLRPTTELASKVSIALAKVDEKRSWAGRAAPDPEPQRVEPLVMNKKRTFISRRISTRMFNQMARTIATQQTTIDRMEAKIAKNTDTVELLALSCQGGCPKGRIELLEDSLESLSTTLQYLITRREPEPRWQTIQRMKEPEYLSKVAIDSSDKDPMPTRQPTDDPTILPSMEPTFRGRSCSSYDKSLHSVYKDHVYRTLTGLPRMDWGDDSCEDSYTEMPDGWELAPRRPDIIEQVVESASWSTVCVVLADGSPWYAYEGNRKGPCGSGNWLRQIDNRYKAKSCNGAVMIRQPCEEAFESCSAYDPTYHAVYDNHVYRTLAELRRSVEGWNCDNRYTYPYGKELPRGWELAPRDLGIVQSVIAANEWNSSGTILRDGSAWKNKSSCRESKGKPGPDSWQSWAWQSGSYPVGHDHLGQNYLLRDGNRYSAFECQLSILIRRPCKAD